ncbi:MAG: hypothetical protein CMM46_13140 [Rhodospirillaceae bacterium]|nr:hypothetical protein [Rhodospirillaceae bacterium]|tara:strand:+ start:8175 stop:9350 length:1176 start_codon:yes stop_codon:yes gene_type:complete
MDKIKPLMEANEFEDKVCSGKLTRRQAHKVLASAGVGTAMATSMPGMARADGSDLVMFTWGGYDDAAFAQDYVREYGSPPTYTLFSDQAEAMAKIRAGFEVDVVFPCSSKIGLWYDAGIVEPVDVSMISHWDDVIEPLKHVPGANTADGQPLWVPEDFGATAIIVNTELAPEYADPEMWSWSIFFDEKYAGRLAMFDAVEDHFNLFAIYAGIDFTDMNDEQIETVANLVRESLPNMRLLTSDTTSMTQALFSGEVVASAAWNGMMLTASGEMDATGTQGKYIWMNPKEGALTWVCGLTIDPRTKERGTYEQAHALLDAYISPESQYYELTEWGYGVSNKKVYDMEGITEEYLQSIGLSSDIEAYLASGKFSVHQNRYGEIVNLYEQILAGM